MELIASSLALWLEGRMIYAPFFHSSCSCLLLYSLNYSHYIVSQVSLLFCDVILLPYCWSTGKPRLKDILMSITQRASIHACRFVSLCIEVLCASPPSYVTTMTRRLAMIAVGSQYIRPMALSFI